MSHFACLLCVCVCVCVCVCARAGEKMFMKIERAKEVLLNKEKRAKYDLWRTGGFKNVMSFEKWYETQHQVFYVSQSMKKSNIY